VNASPIGFPLGFTATIGRIGIKSDRDDVLIVGCDHPATVSGLYTRSTFAGPSVVVSRENTATGRGRAAVVIAQNANVATGERGMENAREVVALTAGLVGCEPTEVAIASTGVIGRPYPMEKVRTWFRGASWPGGGVDAVAAATAMMTTDTHPKTSEARVGGARVVGLSKGVGMIEPDMATLITLVFTDAEISADRLDRMWRRVIDVTFNAVSIDTDTSTSDTALVMASGRAGPVDEGALEGALHEVALDLTRQTAADGEGATKLLVVTVDEARDRTQARRVAKSIVNSPLVKTAVYGADPNWGRVAMAIGKCTEYTDIDQGRVVIRFGDREVYPHLLPDEELEELSGYLRGDEILIHASLRTGRDEFTVYGCDLTEEYVHINADYTT